MIRLLDTFPWDVMCNTVTRTLHTPNVIKLLHQAHIPEASTRGSHATNDTAHATSGQSNTQSSPPPHRTPNAHAADGARYVNVTHEEAAEEPAATTEAGTEGAGTSAETPTWTPSPQPNRRTPWLRRTHRRTRHPVARIDRAHTIRCPEPTESA